MTAISNFYDRIHTVLSSTFSSKNELYNPFDIEDNPDYCLNDGYGVAFGEGSYDGELYGSLRDIKRTVTVVLTERLRDIEQSNTQRKLIEKSLLEDRRTLINALLGDFDTNSTIDNIDVVSDSGIEFARAGNTDILMLSVVFEIYYKDAI